MSDKKTILIIDDDPDIVESVQMILSAAGYAVIAASSARDGIAMLRQQKPDMIFCDMMMESIDSGMQAALEIRKQDAATPIYLLSSIADMTTASSQIQDLGFNGAIQKPVEPTRLIRTVKTTIG